MTPRNGSLEMDAMKDDEMNAAIDAAMSRWLDDGDEHDPTVMDLKIEKRAS